MSSATADDAEDGPVGNDEVVTFPTNCYNCSSPTETRMKLVSILIFSIPTHIEIHAFLFVPACFCLIVYFCLLMKNRAKKIVPR